jgi:hypothetical protein
MPLVYLGTGWFIGIALTSTLYHAHYCRQRLDRIRVAEREFQSCQIDRLLKSSSRTLAMIRLA